MSSNYPERPLNYPSRGSRRGFVPTAFVEGTAWLFCQARRALTRSGGPESPHLRPADRSWHAGAAGCGEGGGDTGSETAVPASATDEVTGTRVGNFTGAEPHFQATTWLIPPVPTLPRGVLSPLSGLASLLLPKTSRTLCHAPSPRPDTARADTSHQPPPCLSPGQFLEIFRPQQGIWGDWVAPQFFHPHYGLLSVCCQASDSHGRCQFAAQGSLCGTCQSMIPGCVTLPVPS